ncbi:uncharacterized protein [Palaemon carinicauda]|uniref:uncharacterized protein n=1 Tax=Palaemon carinicauda TaxID=392227 RepID=UPI0035B578B9
MWLRHRCVMSPWLFNLFVDRVVSEVIARVFDRGLEQIDESNHEWELNQLFFADDTVLVANSEEELGQLVTKFGRVCKRRKLRVIVGKSKVMRCTRREGSARLNGELLEKIGQFKHLVSVVAVNGGVEADVHQRVNEKCSVGGSEGSGKK